MKTVTRLHRLSVRCAVAVVAASLCAVASAAPEKTKKAARTQKVTRTNCYVAIGTSAIPQPCERLGRGIPTTASPMVIIGEHPLARLRN